MIDTLNFAAEYWQYYVWHAAWQGTLVALALLGVVWCARRWPSPLRYGVLVIVLIKFALPPMATLPVGLFSWIETTSPATGSITTDLAERGAPTAAVASTLPEPIRHTEPESAASLSSLPELPVTPSPHSSSRLPLSSLTLSAWLVLAHLTGIGITVLWIIVGMARLMRTASRAHVVTEEDALRLFTEVAQDIGIRRRIRLLASTDAVTPMALGIVRPTVMLPKSMVTGLAHDQLRAIFAHELVHHRRLDLVVNWLQLLVLAVWWFNPIVWLLSRALRAVREECCDDALLGRGLASDATYCDTLLRAAADLPTGPAIGASLGFAEKLHPLGKRIGRIMDQTRPRPVKLSLLGLAVVVIVALALLPGLAHKLQTTKTPHLTKSTPRSRPWVAPAWMGRSC